MIRSFACKETEALFHRNRVKKIPGNIQRVALRKLRILDAAVSLDDLRIPPGNRLEPLKGDREGRWSIRIINQFRICFKFQNSNAFEVEITDYH